MFKNINFEILKNNKYEKEILSWRNDPITRQNSINQQVISVNNHKEWIKSQLENMETKLIMHFVDNMPAGLVKLDKLNKNEFGISINLNPDFRGKKLSSRFINNSLHHLLENQGEKEIEVLASIKPNNVPSINAFERSGFTLRNRDYQDNLYLFSKKLIKVEKILFLGYSEEESNLIDHLKDLNFEVDNLSNKIKPDLFENYDLVISYGYRYILSKQQLEKCLQDPINLHTSYLPWNRGAHPNFWAFYDNTPHGVSIHLIDEGIDTGKILLQKLVKFNKEISFYDSYKQLRKEMEKLFINNSLDLVYNTVKPFETKLEGSFHVTSQLPKDINWKMNIKEYLESNENE